MGLRSCLWRCFDHERQHSATLDTQYPKDATRLSPPHQSYLSSSGAARGLNLVFVSRTVALYAPAEPSRVCEYAVKAAACLHMFFVGFAAYID